MNLIKTLVLVAGVALLPSLSHAQVPPAPGATPANAAASQATPYAERKGGPRKGGERGERFKKADTNGDGALSKTEVDAAGMKRLSANFDKIDTNKDGKISREEMKAARASKKGEGKGEGKGRRAQGAAPTTPATPATPAAPAVK